MAAKKVQIPCSIRDIQERLGGVERGYDCNSPESLFTVNQGGQTVGHVCSDHVTAAMEINGLTHNFAYWTAS